uniref:Uncharacterized protein n=1 Tax=Arundo donax TaxID=35708 RepID=A0A0A9AKD1_ARUDO
MDWAGPELVVGPAEQGPELGQRRRLRLLVVELRILERVERRGPHGRRPEQR